MSERYLVTFYDAITLQRDPYEGRHGPSVAALAVKTAELLDLPPEQITLLKVAAHLHDVGKIGLPEYILNKPGLYTRPERMMVQGHTQIGIDLLKPFRLGDLIYDVVLHHHERFNGTGYPAHLKGRDLHLPAEIVGIADVYDALTNTRPYRAALPTATALEMIAHSANFQSHVLAAFLAAVKQP